MEKFKKNLKILDEFCKEFNLPKKDLIVFGSAVLARNGIKDINNLNISLPSMQYKKLINNPDITFENVKKDCEATLTKGTLQFTNNDCNSVKFGTLNKDTILIGGFKHISIDTWKEMQKKYGGTEKQYIVHPRLLK